MTPHRLAVLATVLTLTAAATSRADFANITIDGDFSDWAGIAPAATDSSDATTVDFANLYLANDDDYLYIRISLNTAADATTFTTNLYVNGDNNAATGFQIFGTAGFGSEILIQSSSAFQQAGGGFNEGLLTDAMVIESPFATASTDFELRISRDVTGVSGAFVGQSLITEQTIAVQLVDDSGDSIPDSVAGQFIGASYTFVVPEPASLVLLGLGGLCLASRGGRRSA